MLPSGLAWTLGDRVVLVSCCLLVDSVPVEDVDVLLVPELSVAEYNSGSDDCEDEGDAGSAKLFLLVVMAFLR